MSWFIAQPLFKFPDCSSSRFSAFHILLPHFHVIVFHFLPGWPLANIYRTSAVCQASYGVWKYCGERVRPWFQSAPLRGAWAQDAALILPWISSLLIFSTDFWLVTPYSCVSQFLKISLFIFVYTYIHKSTHINSIGSVSLENPDWYSTQQMLSLSVEREEEQVW